MRPSIACVLGMLVASSAGAQNILTLPGKTVEVLGLRRWTIAMIQDSMAKYAPGESLASHACAAVLRYKLGFADASATTYWGMTPDDTIRRIVVALVEPQDSARVRQRAMPMDTTKPIQAWAVALRIVDSAPAAAFEAARAFVSLDTAKRARAPEWLRGDTLGFRRYQQFIAAHSSDRDYRRALDVLSGDANYRNRTVAATLLTNFMTRDSAIYALVDALMEQDGPAKSMAAIILEAFVNHRPRPIDWRPKTTTLHAALDGTVSALPIIMRLVAATGNSTLARPLLANGAQSVLDFHAATHPGPKHAAHQLLVALAGRDLGMDTAVWRDWIRGL